MAPLVVYRVLGDESQDTWVDPSFGLDLLKMNNTPLEVLRGVFPGEHSDASFYLVRAGVALTAFNAFGAASCRCVTVTLAVNELSFLEKCPAGLMLLMVNNPGTDSSALTGEPGYLLAPLTRV
ncbi:hypothetical protein LXL04_017358 [Taraxacum kok-saghyz]